MELHKFQSLLDQVGTRIKHGEEIAREKGENFNIFKILNLETRENQTHSAFLREMLDPKGSHEMGGIFLTHFLSQIRTKLSEEKTNVLSVIKSEQCTVKTEHSIGQNDLIEKTGGRFDIFINYNKSYNKSYNIVIENKIYAADQEAQIERYCKHERDSSIVYYLTLEGTEPTPNSKGSFESGKDFFLLSYRSDIISWLEICMKEATEKPILRETIKQYIILLKKLTNQLTNQKMEAEIKNLIRKNLCEARKVYDLYSPVLSEIRKEFRDAVAEKIKDATGCEIDFSSSLDKGNAKIIFKSKSNLVYISAEPFSFSDWLTNLNVGIWISMSKVNQDVVKDFALRYGFNFSPNELWLNREVMDIQLGDLTELQKLTEENHFNKKVDEISKGIINYYNKNKKYIYELEQLLQPNINQTQFPVSSA